MNQKNVKFKDKGHLHAMVRYRAFAFRSIQEHIPACFCQFLTLKRQKQSSLQWKSYFRLKNSKDLNRIPIVRGQNRQIKFTGEIISRNVTKV